MMWSWILTLMGVTCFWLAGKKVWWAWYIGLATQAVWLAYSIATEQWGFLAGCLFYTVTYIKNAAQWTGEHRALATPLNENPTDSNLVAHAIRELDIIGETSYEEPSMRKCVLDIVRTFAGQGHSGFSASYLSAVLDKLLRFQPLSPITDSQDDWMKVADDLWQCRRDSECFSTDGGKTYTRTSDRETIHKSVPA